MPFKRKFTSAKKPTVTVHTKKMPAWSDKSEGEWKNCHCCGKFFVLLLLIANVVLTGLVLYQQRNIESMRVGGRENYEMLRDVFESEGFKAQQKQQIQQAMQMYQVPADDVEETPAQ